MKKIIFFIICILLGCGHIYAIDYVKERSDDAVKGCKTFEDKTLELRRYVHRNFKVMKPGIILSDEQIRILSNYYPPSFFPYKEEKIVKQKDYDYFMNKIRYSMNTCDKLDFGYGRCDDLANVFMHLAQKQNITTRMVWLYIKEGADSSHAIVEALDPEGRWVIIDLDPSYNLELFNKEKKIASRKDIRENRSILQNNAMTKKWPDDRLSMYYNDLAEVKYIIKREGKK